MQVSIMQVLRGAQAAVQAGGLSEAGFPHGESPNALLGLQAFGSLAKGGRLQR